MVLSSLLVLGTLSWFGPAKASFPAPAPGNPWDDKANDVRVVFTAADGHQEERLAYFESGRWTAVLTTQHPGDYRAALVRNGAPVEGAGAAVEVKIRPEQKLATGFVRVRGTSFCTDDDRLYFPLGYNLCWRNGGEADLPTQLRALHTVGVNWTRIWACAWDGKNPVYRKGQAAPLGEFLPEALQQWDDIVRAAEDGGVRFQFVLLHHGLFSTTNDSNWDTHPWNKANGGFLEKPADFFTDPRAKEYVRRWLRVAVARWGHSPAIMAWELFNEVEWTDATRADHGWETVAAWHAEMAAYLRSIDPYHHLVTSSAARKHPELYASLDYFQPHSYAADVHEGIASLVPIDGKPAFFGEFGGHTEKVTADERLTVRKGIWAGILSGHAGAAQYWFWDRVGPLGLNPEFSRTARILWFAKFEDHPQRHRQDVRCSEAGLTVHALGDARFSLVHIAGAVAPESTATLRIPDLSDGTYAVLTTNLDTGTEVRTEATAKAGTLAGLTLPAGDHVLLLTAK